MDDSTVKIMPLYDEGMNLVATGYAVKSRGHVYVMESPAGEPVSLDVIYALLEKEMENDGVTESDLIKWEASK